MASTSCDSYKLFQRGFLRYNYVARTFYRYFAYVMDCRRLKTTRSFGMEASCSRKNPAHRKASSRVHKTQHALSTRVSPYGRRHRLVSLGKRTFYPRHTHTASCSDDEYDEKRTASQCDSLPTSIVANDESVQSEQDDPAGVVSIPQRWKTAGGMSLAFVLCNMDKVNVDAVSNLLFEHLFQVSPMATSNS
jgi:hypothetical protein